MTTLTKLQFSRTISEAVLTEISSRAATYYYFVSKPTTYGVNDDTVETPSDSYDYELSTRSEIIHMKQIKSSDVAYVIPKYEWVSGEVYDIYDDSYSDENLSYSGASRLEDAVFYVVTDSFNVYKCISNNGDQPSTIKPTLTDYDQFETADGYIWKFMLNIPAGLRNKFLYKDNLPISNLLNNTFYNDGAISSVIIEEAGSGYSSAPTLVVSGDGYLEENPYIITNVDLIDGGSGYSVAPSVTISTPTIISGNEIQATADSALTADSVSSFTLTEVGFGYDINASVTIEPPFTANDYSVNLAVVDGDYIHYNNNYYLVVGTGDLGSSSPTHTSGTVTSGDVDLTFSGRRALAQLTQAKTEASLTAVVSGGEIVNVVVDDGGVGYTTGTVTVTGGGGSGAVLLLDFTIGNLNTLQSNVELLAVDGSIDFIKMESIGSGYTVATVTITGDGTGATATANVANGQVNSINITNRGSLYRRATVTITGDGTGATARPIISPIGGHGKNAINELLGSKLMFFSNLGELKSDTVILDNDFRQTGIIKNPRKYSNSALFKAEKGTTCFTCTALSTIDTNDISNDDELVSGTKTFVVVSVSGTKIVLYSKINSVPEVSDTLTNQTTGGSLIISEIVNPDIDKYSGELIFIDNRSSYSSSDTQSISLRTIVNY